MLSQSKGLAANKGCCALVFTLLLLVIVSASERLDPVLLTKGAAIFSCHDLDHKVARYSYFVSYSGHDDAGRWQKRRKSSSGKRFTVLSLTVSQMQGG